MKKSEFEKTYLYIAERKFTATKEQVRERIKPLLNVARVDFGERHQLEELQHPNRLYVTYAMNPHWEYAQGTVEAYLESIEGE